MRYTFPCDIIRDDVDGREAYAVSFPDVHGAYTSGWSWEEAIEMAEDCLEVALGTYMELHEDIPTPSPLGEGQILIPVPAIIAAMMTLYTAMREQGITSADLSAQLGINERAVRRLYDPHHRAHMIKLEKALRAVGRSLVVEDESAVPPIPDHAREPSQAVLPVGAED